MFRFGMLVGFVTEGAIVVGEFVRWMDWITVGVGLINSLSFVEHPIKNMLNNNKKRATDDLFMINGFSADTFKEVGMF